MLVRELNRAVSRLTGESVGAIQKRGFHIVSPAPGNDDQPRVIDWDRGKSAFLSDDSSQWGWPGRVDALPSHDEEFIDDELRLAVAEWFIH